MSNYSIGFTAHNIENELIRTEFLSLIENNVKPDFVIFHQKFYKRKLIELIKNIRQSHDQEYKKIHEYLKNIEIFNISNLNSAKAKSVFEKFDPAIIICNSGLLKQKTINANPRIIFINKHCSQLPKYRGVNNVEWALWDKSQVFASIIRIHHGIDEGDILYQKLIEIDFKTQNSIGKVRNFCFKQICSLTGMAISDYLNSKIDFVPQTKKGEPMLQYFSMHPIIRDKLEERIKKGLQNNETT